MATVVYAFDHQDEEIVAYNLQTHEIENRPIEQGPEPHWNQLNLCELFTVVYG
jgi:hypothetical protein